MIVFRFFPIMSATLRQKRTSCPSFHIDGLTAQKIAMEK
jgi:hypothetical protein